MKVQECQELCACSSSSSSLSSFECSSLPTHTPISIQMSMFSLWYPGLWLHHLKLFLPPPHKDSDSLSLIAHFVPYFELAFSATLWWKVVQSVTGWPALSLHTPARRLERQQRHMLIGLMMSPVQVINILAAPHCMASVWLIPPFLPSASKSFHH